MASTTAKASTRKSHAPKLFFEGNVPAMNRTEWGKIIKKLGWSKNTGSDYQVINLDAPGSPIATTSDPDQFMIEHGIPNLKKLQEQDVDLQKRFHDQIKRSYIDARLLTNAKEGRPGLSHAIPSDHDIQSILLESGFEHSQGPEGRQVWSFTCPRSMTKSVFYSLEQVRVLFRMGKLSSRTREKQLVLSLQLWAASSPEDVPLFDLTRYQEVTAPALDDGDKNDKKACSLQSERGQRESESETETDSSQDTVTDPPTRRRPKRNPLAAVAPGHDDVQAIANQGQPEGVGLVTSPLDSQQQPTQASASDVANDVTPDKNAAPLPSTTAEDEDAEDDQDQVVDNFEDMTVEQIIAMTDVDRSKLAKMREDDDSTQRKGISRINDIITNITSLQTELREFDNDAGIFRTCFPKNDPYLSDKIPLNNIVHTSGMEWEEIDALQVQRKRQLERMRERKRKLTAILSLMETREEMRRVKRKSEHPLALKIKETSNLTELHL